MEGKNGQKKSRKDMKKFVRCGAYFTKTYYIEYFVFEKNVAICTF